MKRTGLLWTGLKPEDVLGQPFWETWWWSYSPEAQLQLKNAIGEARSGRTIRYDTDISAAEGKLATIGFSLVPMLDDEGYVSYLIPSGIDITDRKRATANLRNSEERFRSLVEATATIVWSTSPSGKFEEAQHA